MSQQEAGWYNDPYGRFQQRYWDGGKWTEHVSTEGAQQVDPLGASTVIPIAIPPTAYTAPTTEAAPTQGFAHLHHPTAAQPDPDDPTARVDPTDQATGGIGFLDSMGDDARLRPLPTLSAAIAGAGGVAVASAILGFIAADEASKGKVIAASLLVLALGLAVRLFIPNHTELRSAAVGMGAVGIIGFGAGVAGDDFGRTWPLLLVAALLVAAWALPGFKGRPLMLGLGALFLVFALGAAFANDPECFDDGFGGEICDGSAQLFSLPSPFNNLLGDQQVVFLLAAAVLLGLVWWLDNKGYHGTATPLVASGLLASLIGTGQSWSNLGDAGPALLIIAVGVLVCMVGSFGARRATTWWGAAIAAIGTIALFVAMVEPDSTTSSSLAILLAGAALIGAPAIVRLVISKRSSGPSAPAGNLEPPSFAPPAS